MKVPARALALVLAPPLTHGIQELIFGEIEAQHLENEVNLLEAELEWVHMSCRMRALPIHADPDANPSACYLAS